MPHAVSSLRRRGRSRLRRGCQRTRAMSEWPVNGAPQVIAQAYHDAGFRVVPSRMIERHELLEQLVDAINAWARARLAGVAGPATAVTLAARQLADHLDHDRSAVHATDRDHDALASFHVGRTDAAGIAVRRVLRLLRSS